MINGGLKPRLTFTFQWRSKTHITFIFNGGLKPHLTFTFQWRSKTTYNFYI